MISYRWITGIAAILILISILPSTGSSKTIAYEDSVNDVKNNGIEKDFLPSIDIISLKMETSNGNLTVSLEVHGIVAEFNDDVDYSYTIYFDNTGNNETDIVCFLSTWCGMEISGSEGLSGSGTFRSDWISGSGTSIVRVILLESFFESYYDYLNVYATAMITTAAEKATDHINYMYGDAEERVDNGPSDKTEFNYWIWIPVGVGGLFIILMILIIVVSVVFYLKNKNKKEEDEGWEDWDS